MITVLIACGANELMIPCRIFENMKKGIESCDKIFMPYIKKEDKIQTSSEKVVYKCYPENLIDHKNGHKDPVSEQLFTKYYYGCGGPYRFVLKCVEYDKKFVSFDLD